MSVYALALPRTGHAAAELNSTRHDSDTLSALAEVNCSFLCASAVFSVSVW